ncbi:hypothetical protein [Agrococcus carbonis]|uniref:Uncharacterized protein n=1 Tax=Agrococcus carbonis TaxID=684552 RepID=A0A1H1RDA0_9MICO|nr:hypothetical protein [Agrococcus carbonis]SDS33668.1 hypothetical protein SAMN04489719_2087 [Agrococcus carbonis]
MTADGPAERGAGTADEPEAAAAGGAAAAAGGMEAAESAAAARGPAGGADGAEAAEPAAAAGREPGAPADEPEPTPPLVIRKRGRRVTTEPPPGYTAEPALERQQSSENDARLRGDVPPHWG